MDLTDEKPRQYPKPVPFCQTALLQPIVPEVSLLLQENPSFQSEKKNDSFSGSEFQTYNSWRWKHMNLVTSSSSLEPTKANKHTNDGFLIKDKYFTSNIEKRKNEILYNQLEEPRRPLPPRANSVIPSCIESFFSNSSFDDVKPITNFQESQHKNLNFDNADKNMVLGSQNQSSFKNEFHNSEKLYSIISEQNKQIQVLQNQIEQLLKLQEVKDKQIEQLLKSQETKEKKIEQLLQSSDYKDKEIQQLKNLKQEQEQCFQQLLKTQENLQKENSNLLKSLNEIKQKDVHSVGVMAFVQLADANTCTTLDGITQKSSNTKTDNTFEEDISCIRDSSRFDEKDKSLSLHSSDLPVIQENAPSPQSSIHVDIQDFQDSSDDNESEIILSSSGLSTSKETQSGPLGYTFYNNVLTQVKDIIQNSGDKEKKNSNGKSQNQKEVPNQSQTHEHNFLMENKKPVQSFQPWDIFDNKNFLAQSSDQERNDRLSDKMQNICFKDTSSPSDVSLKINALAMKYLKQEQISENGLQAQIPTSCQPDVTICNVTNLSFGSVRYLDRYQMLAEKKENQKHMAVIQKNELSPAEFLRRKKRMTIKENIMTSVGNILDITILNQQPKLL